MSEPLDHITSMPHQSAQKKIEAHGEYKFSLLRMFSRRWLLATILVVIAVGVMARLGIWQLDRLQQRRAFNERVLAQIEQPRLDLNSEVLNPDLADMEYRPVVVVGQYDHSQEVALRNQIWGNHYGVHLLTPLRILGSDQSVLVDRGWVSSEDYAYENEKWEEYEESGIVEIHGVIRASQSEPDYGSRTDPNPAPGERLTAWYFANVERIDEQVPYSLLPIYIQQAPDPAWTEMPIRSEPDLDLSEGPHLGYAFQWFTFAALLGIGFPLFMRRQERLKKSVTPIEDS
ncbi:MAG: SURF1 family protein [Anaerolineales bacterium]|nr:SURF1 family protein [Anaerolineales bacterium]